MTSVAAERAERDPFYRYGAVLLLLLLHTAAFTFAMIAPPGGWARLVSALLEGGAVLAALSRAQADRWLLCLGVAAIVVTMATATAAWPEARLLDGVADLASACLLVLVPVAIVVEFRRNLRVTAQSVMAALCIYTVLGMFSPMPRSRSPSSAAPGTSLDTRGRMLVSPFTFFRGAAYLMAADAASLPRTLRVQPCGDAHLASFGGLAARTGC